jgi:carbamoyl-phosphate synthase large subunit
MLDEMGLKQPPSGVARSLDEAVACANAVGYPVLVRPSYVLGGRGMEICPDESSLRTYMTSAVNVSDLANAPVLIDRFLNDATEVDVDVVADFEPSEGTRARMISHDPEPPQALYCGVMEHIEEAGIHSGDSTCVVPPFALPPETVEEIRSTARRLAEKLRVRGLMNVQFAVKDGTVYILEVNPRASRTSPFVGKAKGVAWPYIAAQVMMGRSLARLGTKEIPDTGFYAVKESVFPFAKFPGVDVVLGPEMRSTGEVMGADRSLPIAFAKAQMGAGIQLPLEGAVFVSVREGDREEVVGIARDLVRMGFTVFTSRGTGAYLAEHGVETTMLHKLSEGARPTVLDVMANGEVQLIINTPTKKGAMTDEGRIRANAVRTGIPMITTVSAARATVDAIAALRAGAWSVTAIQDYFPHLARPKLTPPRVREAAAV